MTHAGQVMVRLVLVVLGALLLLAALPLLSMSGMMGLMMGGGGMTWGIFRLTLLLIAAGVALVVVGLRQRS
jgi:hypothetical protein